MATSESLECNLRKPLKVNVFIKKLKMEFKKTPLMMYKCMFLPGMTEIFTSVYIKHEGLLVL